MEPSRQRPALNVGAGALRRHAPGAACRCRRRRRSPDIRRVCGSGPLTEGAGEEAPMSSSVRRMAAAVRGPGGRRCARVAQPCRDGSGRAAASPRTRTRSMNHAHAPGPTSTVTASAWTGSHKGGGGGQAAGDGVVTVDRLRVGEGAASARRPGQPAPPLSGCSRRCPARHIGRGCPGIGSRHVPARRPPGAMADDHESPARLAGVDGACGPIGRGDGQVKGRQRYSAAQRVPGAAELSPEGRADQRGWPYGSRIRCPVGAGGFASRVVYTPPIRPVNSFEQRMRGVHSANTKAPCVSPKTSKVATRRAHSALVS